MGWKVVGGGGIMVGWGKAGRLSGKGGESHNAIVKNPRRRQSIRGKAEGEGDNDCQGDRTDDAGGGAPKVDYDQHEGTQSKRNDADDDHGFGNRLGLDFEGKFHAPKRQQPIKKRRKS